MRRSKMLIDGDGCNVIQDAEIIAANNGMESHIYCNTTKIITSEISTVHIVDKSPDAADFALLNQCRKNDIVITADTGLAAMALTLDAIVLNPKGFEYTANNIDPFLVSRHLRKQAVRQTGRNQVSMTPMKTKRMNFTKLLNLVIERVQNEQKFLH